MTAKKTAKKKAARKPAVKKAAAKAPAKKKSAAKKKTRAKQAAPEKSDGDRKDAPEPAKKATGKSAGVSSASVNLGHVFALKPRVETSFRQADLATARHQLLDEHYATLEEAARAVAEKALELTRGGPGGASPKRSKRWS
jgi:hypothetical protein